MLKQNPKVGHRLDVTPNTNFLMSLRSSGYNNYTAIADIVDNSIDTNVGSKNVNIHVSKDSISICDDGCGMDINTLNEAFKLGAMTGKIKRFDLGAYGTGLKAAALSIGRIFEVQTKTEEGDFYVAEYDLDEIIKTNTFSIPIRVGTKKEYTLFLELTGSKTGTVVTLSKLDRVTNGNLIHFKNKLSKDFGLFYKRFIDELGVKLFINLEEVKSIDPMCRKELFSKRISELNEKFTYKEKTFHFNAFYLSRVDDETNKRLEVQRNYKNRGLYIYRNNRLVGRGVDLGIINKHGDGYFNGLRVELFIDGEDDVLFGSTFMKVIHERDKDEVDQGFRDACNKALSPYIRATMTEEKSGKGKDIDKGNEEEFKNLMKPINESKLIQIPKRGKNYPTESPQPKTEPTGIRRTVLTRTRNDIFTDWKFVSLGEGGNVFNVSKDRGIYVVHMNTDHVFWQEFLSKANNEIKGILARFFVSMAISLDSIGYYDDTEKEILLQEYLLETSNNLRKLIIG